MHLCTPVHNRPVPGRVPAVRRRPRTRRTRRPTEIRSRDQTSSRASKRCDLLHFFFSSGKRDLTFLRRYHRSCREADDPSVSTPDAARARASIPRSGEDFAWAGRREEVRREVAPVAYGESVHIPHPSALTAPRRGGSWNAARHRHRRSRLIASKPATNGEAAVTSDTDLLDVDGDRISRRDFAKRPGARRRYASLARLTTIRIAADRSR